MVFPASMSVNNDFEMTEKVTLSNDGRCSDFGSSFNTIRPGAEQWHGFSRMDSAFVILPVDYWYYTCAGNGVDVKAR